MSNVVRARALLVALFCFTVSISSFAEAPRDASGGSGTAASAQAPVAVPAAVVLPDEQSLKLDERAAAAKANRPSSFWALFRTILALLVVAAAVYGVVYAIKRFSKPASETADTHLKVLASAHLGSNRFVHVVSLGEKTWVLGATDGGVSLIDTVEDRELVDTLRLEDSKRASTVLNAWDFRSLVKRMSAGRGAGPGTESPNADRIRNQRNRLRNL